MQTILDKIIGHKQAEIAAAQRALPTERLEDQLAAAPPVRDFAEALSTADGVALIAEVKKASPSAGLIRQDFDPVRIAGIYEQHGAACMSVLTDAHFFGGHLDDLRGVREAVSIPVLRKDFLLDRYQILEARAAGADCVLLIAECLDDQCLRDLYGYAAELGMRSLVEIYESANLERVLRLKPTLVGINNRNLKTFDTNLEHTLRLAEQIPAGTLLVSESGISSRDDVLRLQRAGVRGMLVGETLMRSDDIGAKMDELLEKTGTADKRR